MNLRNLDEVIEKYLLRYPLLRRMEYTEQDPVFHAEGNVKIHTQMVLDEAWKIIDSGILTDREEKLLIFSAIFHDYAKSITTTTDVRGGRECVVSPGHEDVGAAHILLLPAPDELTPDEWVDVARLVKYHQMCKKAVRKEFTRGEYLELQRNVGDMHLLYLLEVCDFRGRDCVDIEEQFMYLEEFWAQCSALDLTRPDGLTPKQYALGCTAMAEGRIYDLAEVTSLPFNYEDRPEVTIMCGLPGSGKSTYASSFTGTVISLDEIRRANPKMGNDEVRRTAMDLLRASLRNNEEVLWDATCYRKDFRLKVRDLAWQYGAFVRIVVVTTDLFTCITNDGNRQEPVGAEVISNQYDRFQMPSQDEADELIFFNNQ